MTHWAAAYIGTPWVAGESDCWSFLRTVYRARFGHDVPPVPVDPCSPRAARHAFGEAPEASGWQAVTEPVEGDAVLMAKGRHPCHVGVWITPPGGPAILHSVERAGVIATPAHRLADTGFRLVSLHRRTA